MRGLRGGLAGKGEWAALRDCWAGAKGEGGGERVREWTGLEK